MITKRIIPCLDIKNGRVVKGVNFVSLKDAGDPVKNAVYYDAEGADELVFLDITASVEKRRIILDLVKKVGEAIFIAFTVGGGIKSKEEIREILLAGADKISLNTQAVKNPRLITESSAIFGSQCVVVAIDAKKTGRKKWEVYIHGGRTPTGKDVLRWAEQAEKSGAGELLVTSIDFDGTQDGYDCELLEEITRRVRIPVIASGGAGKREHFLDAFKSGASAALAASIFHYRTYKIREIKKYLAKKKVPVRIEPERSTNVRYNR